MFDYTKYEHLYVINPNGHFFCLEQEKCADPSKKWSLSDFIEQDFKVFLSYDAMIKAASAMHNIPEKDLIGTELIFRQENGERGQCINGPLQKVVDEIEIKELGNITTLQYIAQYSE